MKKTRQKTEIKCLFSSDESEDDDINGNNTDLDRILDPAHYVLHSKNLFPSRRQTTETNKVGSFISYNNIESVPSGQVKQQTDLEEQAWKLTTHHRTQKNVEDQAWKPISRHKPQNDLEEQAMKRTRRHRWQSDLEEQVSRVPSDNDWPSCDVLRSRETGQKRQSIVSDRIPSHSTRRTRPSSLAVMRNLQLMTEGSQEYNVTVDHTLRQRQGYLQKENTPPEKTSMNSPTRNPNSPSVSGHLNKMHERLISDSNTFSSHNRKQDSIDHILDPHFTADKISESRSNVPNAPGCVVGEKVKGYDVNKCSDWNSCLTSGDNVSTTSRKASGSRVAECGSDDDQRMLGGVWTPSDHSVHRTTSEGSANRTPSDHSLNSEDNNNKQNICKSNKNYNIMSNKTEDEEERNTSPCKATRGGFCLDWVSSEIDQINNQVTLPAPRHRSQHSTCDSSDYNGVIEIAGPGFESDEAGIHSLGCSSSDERFWEM